MWVRGRGYAVARVYQQRGSDCIRNSSWAGRFGHFRALSTTECIQSSVDARGIPGLEGDSEGSRTAVLGVRVAARECEIRRRRLAACTRGNGRPDLFVALPARPLWAARLVDEVLHNGASGEVTERAVERGCPGCGGTS